MKKILFSLLWAVSVSAAHADITVNNAWAYETVDGQKVTGAFMKITSSSLVRLIGVDSPDAGKAEIHEMRMDGDVMKMRRIRGVQINSGTTVDLAPGGNHIMLIDLKKTLKAGDTVSLRLTFESPRNRSRGNNQSPEQKKARSESPIKHVMVKATVKPLGENAWKGKHTPNVDPRARPDARSGARQNVRPKERPVRPNARPSTHSHPPHQSH